ncbi:MAG: hypothetical protein WDM76_09450 [Limisphaerales bacterium]
MNGVWASSLGVPGIVDSSPNFTFNFVTNAVVTPTNIPQLAIIRLGTNFALTWPTNAAGFTLESITNLNLSGNWNTVSSPPVVVNGQNTITNSFSGRQMFFRLSR